MPTNVTTDTAVIANHLASFCFGSSAEGPGSFHNPEARTKNCVFVSLAYLLGTTAPKLSAATGVPQPSNESHGMREQDVLDLMNRAQDLGLVDFYALSRVPFMYEGVRGLKQVDTWRWYRNMVLYTPERRGGELRVGHCVVGGYIDEKIMAADFQHGNPAFEPILSQEVSSDNWNEPWEVARREMLSRRPQNNGVVHSTILVWKGAAAVHIR